MLVQTLGTKAAIKGFDKGVVGRFAWPREVEHDAPLISPEVHVARYELTALVDADGFGIARHATNAIQC